MKVLTVGEYCLTLQQNTILKVKNNIRLFQYSVESYSVSVQESTVTLTRTHNTHLITLFLTSYKLSGSSPFSQENEHMNNETIKIG